MNCLTNYIGIDPVTTPNPSSGLFLTQLGFTLRKIKATADLPDETPLQFAQRMVDQAAMFCVNDMLHHIPSVLWNNVIDTKIMPNFTDKYTDYFAGERGVTVRKYSYDKYPLRGFRLSKIHVRGNDTVSSKVVKIIDGAATVSLPPIDLVAGETTSIDLNYVVKNEAFSVVMDFSDVRGAVPTTFFHTCVPCTHNAAVAYEIQSAYGIAVDFAFECREERILCAVLPYLRFAILYRTGIEILQAIEANDRVNFFAIHKAEWREKNLALWQKNYQDELRRKLSAISNTVRCIDYACFSDKRFTVVYQNVF